MVVLRSLAFMLVTAAAATIPAPVRAARGGAGARKKVPAEAAAHL
jgi:hypothetical protein